MKRDGGLGAEVAAPVKLKIRRRCGDPAVVERDARAVESEDQVAAGREALQPRLRVERPLVEHGRTGRPRTRRQHRRREGDAVRRIDVRFDRAPHVRLELPARPRHGRVRMTNASLRPQPFQIRQAREVFQPRVVELRGETLRRADGLAERLDRVRKTRPAAAEVGVRVGDLESIGVPDERSVQVLEVQAGHLRMLAREVARELLTAVVDVKNALETAFASDVPGLMGEEQLAHAAEVDFGRNVVALLGPVPEIHLAVHVRARAVSREIDVRQRDERAVEREARRELLRRHRQELLNLHRALRERRRAEVLPDRSDEIEPEVRRDDAPRRRVVLEAERAVVGLHELQRRREAFRAVRCRRVLEARHVVAAAAPGLDEDLPARHADLERDLAIGHQVQPVDVHADVLRLKEWPVGWRPALDDDVVHAEVAWREVSRDSADVQRMLEPLRAFTFGQALERAELPDVDREDRHERRRGDRRDDGKQPPRPGPRPPAAPRARGL